MALGGSIFQDAGPGRACLRTRAGFIPGTARAKPARDVRIGDRLRVTNEGGDFEVEVLLLSEVRGPAPVAQTLYRESEASKELRMKLRRRSVEPCGNSKNFPQAGHPSAIAGESFNFAAEHERARINSVDHDSCFAVPCRLGRLAVLPEFDLAKSAVDVIGPAFEHAKKQLIEPFRLGQWARLAILAMATGEMSSGSGCNSGFKVLSSLPSRFPTPSQNFAAPSDVWANMGLDPSIIVTLVIVAVVGFLILGLVWLYVSSVSRFVLFESVLRKHCELGESWGRWQAQGLRLFGFQLALSIVGIGVAALLLIPFLLPLLPTLKNHGAPGPGLLLALLPMILVLTVFGLFMALIGVLTKDFVVPLMAVDHVGVIEGWRRLLEIMKTQKASYAGYIGMKIVLALGASIVFGIASGIVAAIAMVPFVIVGVIAVLLGKSGGLSWNAVTITAAIVAGTILLSVLLYVIALVCVPVAVFFPAYAMYFFAERYPALHALLYPPAPPAVPPPSPPLSPLPEPIG